MDALRGLSPGDIWLALVLGHATRCALSVTRFRRGKWRAAAGTPVRTGATLGEADNPLAFVALSADDGPGMK